MNSRFCARTKDAFKQSRPHLGTMNSRFCARTKDASNYVQTQGVERVALLFSKKWSESVRVSSNTLWTPESGQAALNFFHFFLVHLVLHFYERKMLERISSQSDRERGCYQSLMLRLLLRISALEFTCART